MKIFMKTLLALGLVASTMGLTGCRWSTRLIIGDGHGRRGDWCGRDRWGDRYCDAYMISGSHEVLSSAGKFVTHDLRVARVSDRYDISHYAATKVVRALILAERGQMAGFHSLGLTTNDAKRVYNGEKLSERKLAAVGEKLNMSNDDTETLFRKIADVVRAAQ